MKNSRLLKTVCSADRRPTVVALGVTRGVAVLQTAKTGHFKMV